MRTLRLLLAAALFSPLPLAAQTVQGRIMDPLSTPVPTAEVLLVNEAGEVRGKAASDADGVFRIPADLPGEYRLRVRHLGFSDLTSDPIRVAAGETVTVEIRLSQAAIPLRPITVIGRSSDPRHTAFHERRLSRRQGAFITRADIERTPHARTTDLLRNVSGITILSSHNPGRSSLRGNLISIRGGGGMCEPSIYVDGVRVNQYVQSSMDDVLQAGMIEGIEIYTAAAAAPAGFGGQGNTCGVVMFWTRVGPEPGGTGLGWKQILLGAGLLGALFLVAQ
jgi:hypothetical protein